MKKHSLWLPFVGTVVSKVECTSSEDMPKNRRRVRRRTAKDGNANNANTNNDCVSILRRDGMAPESVRLSHLAATLSKVVYDAGMPDYDYFAAPAAADGTYYESASNVDAIYSAHISSDNVCAIAFRGTTYRTSLDDFWSNTDVGAFPFSEECDIHTGFHDSYTHFEHKSVGIDGFLKECLRDCPTCDILFTGHSHGGSIAEIAALYYLRGNNSGDEKNPKDTTAEKATNDKKSDGDKTVRTETTNKKNKRRLPSEGAAAEEEIPRTVHVVTFGSVQGLGAGCLPLFTKEERCFFKHYIAATEGSSGGLLYDFVPMLYPRMLTDLDNDGLVNEFTLLSANSYARKGGLAFVGHEILVTTADPLRVVVGDADSHFAAGITKMDLTTKAHYQSVYASLLAEQDSYYNSNNNNSCYLPMDGFSVGTHCDPDAMQCIEGISECTAVRGWWEFWSSDEPTCRFIDNDDDSTQTDLDQRFCHERLHEWKWTFLP